jgi:hypothetical protein
MLFMYYRLWPSLAQKVSHAEIKPSAFDTTGTSSAEILALLDEEAREHRRFKRRVLGRGSKAKRHASVTYLVSEGELPTGTVPASVLFLEIEGLTAVQLTRLKNAGIVAPVPDIRIRTTGRPAYVYELEPTIAAIREHRSLKAVA